MLSLTAERPSVKSDMTAPPSFYRATNGNGDALDEGGPLLPFIAGLQETFSDLDGEDVAVWLIADGFSRLVAVLSPDATGRTAVRWL
jgi:hypothetical protein